MYEAMVLLINKKYYATAAAAQAKLNVFFAFNQLTEEQYTELMVLVEQVYGE